MLSSEGLSYRYSVQQSVRLPLRQKQAMCICVHSAQTSSIEMCPSALLTRKEKSKMFSTVWEGDHADEGERVGGRQG